MLYSWLAIGLVAIFANPVLSQQPDLLVLLARGELGEAKRLVTARLQQEPNDLSALCDQVTVGAAMLTEEPSAEEPLLFLVNGMKALIAQEDRAERTTIAMTSGLKALENAALSVDDHQVASQTAAQVLDKLADGDDPHIVNAVQEALRVALLSLMQLDRFDEAEALVQQEWKKSALEAGKNRDAIRRRAAVASVAVQTLDLTAPELVNSLVEQVSQELYGSASNSESLKELLNFERAVLLEMAMSQPEQCEIRFQQLTDRLAKTEEPDEAWSSFSSLMSRVVRAANKSQLAIGNDQAFVELQRLLLDESLTQWVGTKSEARHLTSGRQQIVLLWSAKRRGDLQALQQLSRWHSNGKWKETEVAAVSLVAGLEWSEQFQLGVKKSIAAEQTREKELDMLKSIHTHYSIAFPCGLLGGKAPSVHNRNYSVYLVFSANGTLLKILPAQPKSLPVIEAVLAQHN